ncbi:hypothetical protein TNCV_4554661 [Trichonephila clavipes]|nr:hypothetical protein TNCV_4554661 [Trichonephila clavipes]
MQCSDSDMSNDKTGYKSGTTLSFLKNLGFPGSIMMDVYVSRTLRRLHVACWCDVTDRHWVNDNNLFCSHHRQSEQPALRFSDLRAGDCALLSSPRMCLLSTR